MAKQQIEITGLRYLGADGLSPKDAFKAGKNMPKVGSWNDEQFEGRIETIEEDRDMVNLQVTACPANPNNCPFRFSWVDWQRNPYKGCHAVDLPPGFYWRKYFSESKSVGSTRCKLQ